MNGWLIYRRQDAEENRSYIDWFIDEAYQQNIHLKLIYREQLTIGIMHNKQTVLYQHQVVKLPAFAVIRIMEPTLSMHLEACHIQVFNNKDISLMANDKIRTHQAIYSLGIPMVDTVYINSTNPGNPPFSFPFIIKEPRGRGGQQVFLINNQVEWEQKEAKLNSPDFLAQRCNVQLGIDIRVFVVGKEIIGAVKRMNQNDFRANFKLGGTVTWYALNKEEIKVIHKIIAHFDFGMVGIDFLIGENGELLLNEIEDIVGSRSLSKVSNINILQKYITFIKQKIKNQHST